MKKGFFLFFTIFVGSFFAQAESTQVENRTVPSPAKRVFVVPVHGEINKANWYLFRRGVKKATEEQADILVLDINTPGGELSATFDYIDTLQKFSGKTFAFVNPDAISAGAYISGATQEIFFSPNGKIGAAAVVSDTGSDIGATMKMKIESYLSALTKTFSKENPRRANVLRAMFDADYVLKIDGEILPDVNGDPVKTKGMLLTLTATEAMRPVGSPATPLFGAGIYENIPALLDVYLAGTPYTIERIEPVGLEKLAQYASPFLPVLLGLGMLLIFIEIKSPGFGVPGASGIVLIALYFALQYAAGLAGYEGVVLFTIGVALILIEIFLVPGIFIFAIAGMLCIIGSIFWSGIDLWKLPDGSFDFRWDMLSTPLEQLGLTIVTIFVATLLAWKLLPARFFRNKIILQNKTGELDDVRLRGSRERGEELPPLGATGTALTDFRPLGIVKVADHQFEASVDSGAIQRGDNIYVVGFRDFELIVRKTENILPVDTQK